MEAKCDTKASSGETENTTIGKGMRDGTDAVATEKQIGGAGAQAVGRKSL